MKLPPSKSPFHSPSRFAYTVWTVSLPLWRECSSLSCLCGVKPHCCPLLKYLVTSFAILQWIKWHLESSFSTARLYHTWQHRGSSGCWVVNVSINSHRHWSCLQETPFFLEDFGSVGYSFFHFHFQVAGVLSVHLSKTPSISLLALSLNPPFWSL